ncbi:hypothetical protein B1772_01185 [Dehalococcoides mccartyi]|jgi:hypothetical protein|uniref:hypothetical protein n=1 Tax=Dehalococcoides mccartyi TaxID=61435 RepID=UPI0009A4BE81|nr:hypothetical protein [Dehalococcoides mccartyi]AQY72715.1 hypothetical protein B1772_01185 [Dehalococcoides mccartyi]
MGPITLFDKSFLQSLNVDESVWFDHFFLTNVCPLFYVETMADLEKSPRKGRTEEDEVKIIADKFPQMHGMPCAHHTELCTANLLGRGVPMTGQIPLAGPAQLVKTDGKSGAVYEHSPEAEAFSRWQNGEFLEVERLYAKVWRSSLSPLDSKVVAREVRSLDIDAASCKTLEDAKCLAEGVVARRSKPAARMKLALMSLNIPTGLHGQILKRWMNTNHPPLAQYAPYATHILTVVLFYTIALAANLISNERPSSRVDVAYLFYLPFCMMFVSSDRLHEKCASLFMRSDQVFVWGPDLKSGLTELNNYYLKMPDSERGKGVYSFAGDPPEIGSGIVRRLWGQLLPKWNKHEETDVADRPVVGTTIEEIKRMASAPPLSPFEVDFNPDDTERFIIKRRVARRKGSWYQVPKGIKAEQE